MSLMTDKINLAAGTFTIDAAAPDGAPSRSITGLAVPWNVTTTDSLGTKVMFKPGSLPEDGRPPRLLEGHDSGKVRGIVTERVNTDEGMMFTAKLAETRDADDTMQLLLMGAYDSVSVGVVPTKFSFDKSGTMVVEAARWSELSIVAEPAFEQARIEKVAASAHEEENDETPETPIVPEEEPVSESIEAAAPAVIPTQPIQFAQPAQPFKLPSASEYIAKFLAGGAEFAEFNARIRAAAPDVVTTDTPGILPTPIVGPVYNNFRGLRPVIDAIGVKAMPQGGKVFRRPEVTTHTTIGASNGENVALDSGTFVVSDNQVTKGVYGGYVKLSEEDMDWTEPEVLALLLDDMARIYANETDNVAADNLITGITNTNNFTTANIADPTDWVTWMYTAASDILTDSNGWLPTHLFVAPNRWASLGQLEDGQGRPLFPQIGPMNAYGNLAPGQQTGIAFGLQVVVDRNFASGTLAIGHPDGFEIFEQQKGAISVEAADGSLSRIIKFRGYFATLMIDPTKFIKAAFV
jgi:HK97 family phage prohead protease